MSGSATHAKTKWKTCPHSQENIFLTMYVFISVDLERGYAKGVLKN